jgi:hypothetical protein
MYKHLHPGQIKWMGKELSRKEGDMQKGLKEISL